MKALVAILLALVAAACGRSEAPRLPGDGPLFVRYSGSRGTVWIGDRRLGAGFGGVVSPDRRSVAVAAAVRRIDVLDSRGRRRMSARGEFLAWAPDSRRILVRSRDSVRVVDVASGAARTIDASRGDLFGATFSPDGRRIVFSRGGRARLTPCEAKPDLFVAGSRGRSVRRLTSDGRSEFPVWGGRGIAFARIDRNCARFSTDVWLLNPRTRRARRLVSPPRGYTGAGFYGVLPVAWVPRRPVLVAGVNGEFGGPALVVRVSDGAIRKLDWSACGLTPNGRHVVLVRGGAEGPFAIATAGLDGRGRRVVARGDVGC